MRNELKSLLEAIAMDAIVLSKLANEAGEPIFDLAEAIEGAIEENQHSIDQYNEVSFLWQTSTKEGEILDYHNIVNDERHATISNAAAAFGYRIALRNLEEMGLIKLGDIDRDANEHDINKFRELFGG
ncbi:MAG: hypothetical protein OQK82_08355 [Candidatus Pacearchaeota archaeon]|nr:hypothetical protein [Candidatus Pacearchaeota archaeon]